jgi:hypothetical protein
MLLAFYSCSGLECILPYLAVVSPFFLVAGTLMIVRGIKNLITHGGLKARSYYTRLIVSGLLLIFFSALILSGKLA